MEEKKLLHEEELEIASGINARLATDRGRNCADAEMAGAGRMKDAADSLCVIPVIGDRSKLIIEEEMDYAAGGSGTKGPVLIVDSVPGAFLGGTSSGFVGSEKAHLQDEFRTLGESFYPGKVVLVI